MNQLISSQECFTVYVRHSDFNDWRCFGFPQNNIKLVRMRIAGIKAGYPGIQIRVERTTKIIEVIDINSFNK